MVDRRTFNENAEYDHGHIDQARLLKLAGRRGDEFGDEGAGNLKQRKTDARFGDNPLKDVTLKEVDNDSMLDRLQTILRQADVGDEEIIAGIDLTPKGCQKVAAQLGISPDEVPTYISSLRTRLEQEGDDDLSESYRSIVEQKRYTYEPNNGGVTVRDTVNGTQADIQGAKGFSLLSKLQGNPDDQSLLSRYAPLMESDEPASDDESGFQDEIESRNGSMNFFWTIESQTGTGTVTFIDGNKGEPKLKLLSVRDGDGEPIHPDEEMHAEILKQAHAFMAEA